MYARNKETKIRKLWSEIFNVKNIEFLNKLQL